MSNNYIQIKHKQNGSGVIDIVKVLSSSVNNKNNTHLKIKALKDELKSNDELPKSIKNEFDKVYDILLELNDPEIMKNIINSIGDMAHYDVAINSIK